MEKGTPLHLSSSTAIRYVLDNYVIYANKGPLLDSRRFWRTERHLGDETVKWISILDASHACRTKLKKLRWDYCPDYNVRGKCSDSTCTFAHHRCLLCRQVGHGALHLAGECSLRVQLEKDLSELHDMSWTDFFDAIEGWIEKRQRSQKRYASFADFINDK